MKVLQYYINFVTPLRELQHYSPTGVFTDGDDLEGLFLPEELLSDDESGGLLSGCKKPSQNNTIKNGAYYCYCAYVLRISRYSGFLWVVPANTGIFLRGLKPYGESRT